MNLNRIENVINGLYEDDLKLYDYLYDLAYGNPIDFSYLPIYERFLIDKRAEIKSVAVKAILFILKQRDDKYKKVALKYLIDALEDEDLRMTCASALAQAYFGSCDKELLEAFYKIFIDEEENEYLRSACFNAMMGIIGLTSKDLLNRNKGIVLKSSDLNLNSYSDEIKRIMQFIA